MIPALLAGGKARMSAKSKSRVTMARLLRGAVLRRDGINAAAQALRMNRLTIMAIAGQQPGHVVMQVLIDLEPY